MGVNEEMVSLHRVGDRLDKLVTAHLMRTRRFFLHPSNSRVTCRQRISYRHCRAGRERGVMFKNIGLIGILCVLAVANCDTGDPVGSPTNQPPDLSITPMENEEAEVAAMVLSRQLIAPKWLYDRIRTDLQLIRSRYLDSIPQLDIRFVCDFEPSCIVVQIDSGVLFDTSSGGGRIIDSLNHVYRLDTLFRVYGNFYQLKFLGRLNSTRLVDIYARIPGEYCVSTSGFVGDLPKLVIWPDGETFKYFFRDAWGDCLSGCMYSKVFYFTAKDRTAAIVDSFLFYSGNPQPIPAWRDSLRMAIDTAEYYNSWCVDSSRIGF